MRREARQVDGQVGRAVREREGQMKMEEKGRRGRGVRDKGRGGDGERHGVKGGEIRRMQEGRRHGVKGGEIRRMQEGRRMIM